MKYAYQRIVYLPPDLAVVYALEQNFRLDIERGIISGPDRWVYEKGPYFREAMELIGEQGSNYYPGDNDEPWLHSVSTGQAGLTSRSGNELMMLFDLYYERAQVENRYELIIPSPQRINTPVLVSKYLVEANKIFQRN